MTEDEGQQSSFRDDSSDDEADWEEVTVPQTSTAHPADVSHDIEPYNPYGAAAEPSQTAVTGNIEITIQARTKADESARCVLCPLSRAVFMALTTSGPGRKV